MHHLHNLIGKLFACGISSTIFLRSSSIISKCLTQVDGEAQQQPGPSASTTPERGEAQEKILEEILGRLIYNPKAEVRAAASVWLVSLCSFTGRQPKLLARLGDIQEAFSSLLEDSSEMAQVRAMASTAGLFNEYACLVAD